MADEVHEETGIDEDLSALLDDELSEQSAQALRIRIATDPALEDRLATLSRVDAALRAAPASAPSAELRQALRARMLDQSDAAARGGFRRFSRSLLARRWVAAPIAAAAAGLLWLAVLPTPDPSEQTLPLGFDALLSAASDEEIGIALEFETLADLELIEELEVLERLLARETLNAGERG